MGFGLYDIILKIPGAFRIYMFLRRTLFVKKPPKIYDDIAISNDGPLNPTYDISINEDQHGLRMEFASSPFSVVQSREVLQGPTPPIVITKSGDSINIEIGEESLALRLYATDEWKKIEISHDFNQVFGLAEKYGKLNKIGKSYEIWNVDIADMEPNDDPLYKNYPLAITGSGNIWIGLIMDFPGFQIWDLESRNTIKIHVKSKYFIFDFVTATSPKELMAKIAQLTGKMELPPRWALGFHQSHWSYFPASQVREIAISFRDKNMPIDAIYLDIDYLDGFRSFTYDSENFGDLPQLVQDLHQEGFKVVAMIDPGIKKDKGYHVYDEGIANDYFVKHPNGKVYIARVWPGKSVFPDFFNKEVREWWGNLYQKFSQHIGIDGWWNDMNEPSVFTIRGTMPDDLIHTLDDGTEINHEQVHNLFGQMMVNASYNGLKKLQGGKRVFLLSRAAYLGSQKYGWIWSGDNKSAWTHLGESIPKILGTGLVGHFANGPDIAGFREEASPELFARWMQIGVFYPFMRNHYIKFIDQQEPWSFGKEVEQISQIMLKLRYRLMPYIYTQFRQSCVTGIPLMRPMFIEFPKDDRCYAEDVLNNQFMFGPNLLIAPVLKKGDIAKKVYLPEGTWYQFSDKNTYQGGKKVTVAAPLEKINVFVRENSVIPVYKEVGKNMEETHASGIEYISFGNNATGLLYMDDGSTYAYQNDEFGLYRIQSDLSLVLIEGSGYPSTK